MFEVFFTPIKGLTSKTLEWLNLTEIWKNK